MLLIRNFNECIAHGYMPEEWRNACGKKKGTKVCSYYIHISSFNVLKSYMREGWHTQISNWGGTMQP